MTEHKPLTKEERAELRAPSAEWKTAPAHLLDRLLDDLDAKDAEIERLKSEIADDVDLATCRGALDIVGADYREMKRERDEARADADALRCILGDTEKELKQSRELIKGI